MRILRSFLLILALCATRVHAQDTSENTLSEPSSSAERFDGRAGWNEFETVLRENYAYLDRMDPEALEQLFAKGRTLSETLETPQSLRQLLHRTALTFGDPHLIVGPFAEDDHNIIMTSADLLIDHKDGLFRVVDVRANSAADKARIRVGMRVLSVSGYDIAEAARQPYGDILDLFSSEQLSYGATLAVNGLRGADTRSLELETGSGETQTFNLPSPRLFARQVAAMPALSCGRIGYESQIGVVRINNALGKTETIEAFDACLAVLLDSTALVIDLRNTPSGGNTTVARSIIGHFLTEPAVYQIHTIPATERRYGVPRQFAEYAMPRAPNYGKPVYVLHGAWTGSMGEGLVVGLDAAAEAVTIGSDMGDLLGALWNWDLELSGARLDLGGEALFHPDGTPREDHIADIPLDSADRDGLGNDPAMRLVLDRVP